MESERASEARLRPEAELPLVARPVGQRSVAQPDRGVRVDGAEREVTNPVVASDPARAERVQKLASRRNFSRNETRVLR
jgi:hypothetical protein